MCHKNPTFLQNHNFCRKFTIFPCKTATFEGETSAEQTLVRSEGKGGGASAPPLSHLCRWLLVLVNRVGRFLGCGPRAVAVETEMFLQTGNPVRHQPFEVTLELLSHERVKHGTDAAVQVGDVAAHVQGIV